ncbi:MAG: heme ABC transporter ATP-binding protein [Bacteroidota bacterium]
MLELRDLTYRIREKALVEGVGLALHPGEVVAAVGANGAGKTTLLRLLSGELTPTSGSVHLDGRPLADVDPERLARRRAVLPQQSALTFSFSSVDVVRLGRTPHATTGATDLDIARAAMEAAGVAHLAAQRYPTLSGGEQQRVHLARTLAQIWEADSDSDSGRYLLLDEPTASLDLAHQHAVLRIARQCAQAGFGVLAVLHDLNLAAQYADRIAVLRRGRLMAEGTPAGVLTAETIYDAFDIAVLIAEHPRVDCPLVVPIPEHDAASPAPSPDATRQAAALS